MKKLAIYTVCALIGLLVGYRLAGCAAGRLAIPWMFVVLNIGAASVRLACVQHRPNRFYYRVEVQ